MSRVASLRLIPTPDGFGRIEGKKRGLLGTQSISATDLRTQLAGTRILAWFEAGERDAAGELLVASNESEQLFLSPAAVAELTEREAVLIGAPSVAPLFLDIQSTSQVLSSSFRLVVKFVKRGGLASNARRRGAFLDCDGSTYRIPNPIYSACLEAEKLVEPIEDQAERVEIFSRLKSILPDELQSHFSDNYVRQLRLLFAGNFSLDLDIDKDDVRFSPRLFSNDVVFETEAGDLVDGEAEALLTPREHENFSKETFWSRRDNPNVYKLEDHSYVYTSPLLRQALQHVRDLSEATATEKRNFILNPRKVIADRIGGAEAVDVADIFVETQQFSERVVGIDIWTAPVLPWIKPSSNSWLPESFGFRIGEKDVEWGIGSAVPLEAELVKALEQGLDTIEFEGKQLPVNTQSLEAVREVIRQAEAPVHQHPEVDEKSENDSGKEEQASRYFLTVHENFHELDFVAKDDSPSTVYEISNEPPNALKSSLKPHQKEGLTWMMSSAAFGRAGLLADDMGLGKTLQALSLIAKRREQAEIAAPKVSLIVAPTALTQNWVDEMDMHFEPGTFGVVEILTGRKLQQLKLNDKDRRNDTKSGKATIEAEMLAENGVVLTTYETLRDYHMSFARVPFDVVIFDEIQKVKNPTSQLTRAAKTLNGRFKLGLTGTPVENRLQDVWSIIDVIYPGRLGSSREFAKKYETGAEEDVEALRKEIAEPIGQTPPMMIRRMKSDRLKDLPSKQFNILKIDMPEEQANAYANCVQSALGDRHNPQAGRMLEVLHSLRSISLHPEKDLPNDAALLSASAKKSARLVGMLDILRTIREKNEKALVFVEDRAMQEFVCHLIAHEFKIRMPYRINGSVPGPTRQKIVQNFQSSAAGFDVLVLSPKAGGVGLTITAANHVIHLSRWWNPAVEDQATDRCYRIGQQKDVCVHVPLAVHPDSRLKDTSFDLKLNTLLERKRGLSNTLLMPVDADRNAGDLYKDIFFGESDDSEIAAETIQSKIDTPDDGKLSSDEGDRRVRGTLSLSAASKVDSVFTPQVHRFTLGQVRNVEDILKFLDSKEITYLEVRDPYAFVDKTRPMLDRLVGKIGEIASAVQAAEIVCWSPDHVKVRDQTHQIHAPDALKHWNDIVERNFGRSCQPKADFKRGKHIAFHDRWLAFTVRDAGKVRKIRMDLSSGIIGLMNAQSECSITIAEL